MALIVGCTRSGSTWLDRMLRRLSDVHGVGEAGLGRALRRLMTAPKARLPFRVTADRAATVLDKTPANVYDLEHLAAIENARAVHLVRDPRAVAASMIDAARSWADARPDFSVEHAADLWVRAVDEADRARRWWGDHLTTVRYEDLRIDPESQLKRAATALGIPTTAREVRHAVACEALPPRADDRSGRFVRRGLIDGWRQELTASDIQVVERVVGQRLGRFGYVRA